MTGVVGGVATGTALETMTDAVRHEPWHERDRFEEGDLGLGLVHHGDRDPGGRLTWQGDGRAGAVYGAITNRDELGYSRGEVFERVLDRPAPTLRALEGPFVLVAVDGRADRVVVATDKLGSRPCYYRTDGEFLFGSEVKAILSQTGPPTVDERAVNDLVLIGHMWGEHTLAEGVRAIPPGTVLSYDGGERSLSRYWSYDFTEAAPGRGYLDGVVDTYRDAVERVAGTMSGPVGLWLSGGLDSRPIAAELDRHRRAGAVDDLVAYTYDANPPGAGNLEFAREVADRLGVDCREVPVAPDLFVDVMDRTVDLTDGLLRWSSMANLSSVFHVDEPRPAIMLEGAGQGELLGHHLRRYHLTGCDSVVESQYDSEASVDRGLVRRLVDVDVDPMASFVEAAEESEYRSFQNVLKDVHMRHYYSKHQLLSNHLARSRVGTRVPYLDAGFLRHAARLPLAYRMRTYPFTNGRIPYGTTQPKLHLMRELNRDLSRVPYERTNVSPARPMPAHMVGFFAGTAVDRLRGKPTYGGASMVDEWYRVSDAFRARLDDLIDSACDREYFDGDVLRDLQRAQYDGDGNHMNVLSPVTTLELWLRRYVD